MADFMAVTACNQPRLKDHAAVKTIISRYYVDPDLNVGVGFDENTGAPYLFVYGYLWPEAWTIPAGVEVKDFDPYTEETYPDGADGFAELLKEIAPHLEGSLTVQAVGSTKCFFPLSACEWHIEPGGQEVQFTEFRHGATESVVVAPS